MPDPALIATTILSAAEAIPIVAPFDPLIEIVLAIIRAHAAATGGQLATSAQVQAALPPAYQKLVATWAGYTPKGP